MEIAGPGEFGGNKRFELIRRLGEGGMGVVYEALDRELGVRVALKILRGRDAQSLLRFKREFRALQGIDHPNLVRLGELFEEHGQWFFTMELVDGVDLLRYVTGGANGPGEAGSPAESRDGHGGCRCDEERLRAALGQLALGLNALHAAGKVHRDVKPSNIYVQPDGRVVLLDFGLVKEERAREESAALLAVGTVAYMSPEQAASKPVGAPSDWYSVGVLLYEALTGVSPFVGPPVKVCMDKQHIAPQSPSTTGAVVPPDLDRLCLQLLSIDPNDRPGGEDVLARLGVAPPLQRSAAPDTSHPTQSGEFIGREEELEILRDSFETVRLGNAVSVFVHGESGVGKSLLLRHFTRIAATESGAVVLAGRCYERESVPYKAFDGVVDAISNFLRRQSDTEVAALLPRHAAFLPRLFPVLGRVGAITDAPRPRRDVKDLHELRNLGFAALRELLFRIGERRPLMVIIDDLHWADAESLLLLGDLMRPPDAPTLLLLITSRKAPGEIWTSPQAAGESQGLPGEVRVVELGALDVEAAIRLARALLGRESGEVEATARQLAVEARGHPLYIAELARHAALAQEAEGERDVLRLDDVIWTRVSMLPEPARRLLELLAIAGAPLPHEVFREAAGLETAEFSGHVSMLRAANLTRSDGSRSVDPIEPFHDRVREAVLARLDDVSRREHHLRLALVLEGDHTGKSHPELLLRHFAAAGRDDKAAEFAVEAARRASLAFAFDRASALYREALRLGAHEGESLRALQIALGESLANAGRGAEAAEVYLSAADGADTATRLDCQRRAAQQLMATGHLERGIETLRTVLAEVNATLPATRTRALVSLLWGRFRLRLRGLGWKERHENEIAKSDLARLDIYLAVADGIGAVDPIRGTDYQVRALLLALRLGERRRVVRSVFVEGTFTAAMGGRMLARGRRLVAEMGERAREYGDAYLIALEVFCNGVLDYLEARYRSSVEGLENAEALFLDQAVYTTVELNTVRTFLIGSLRELGEFGRWQELQGKYLRDAVRRGDLYAETTIRRIGTFLWLVRDQPGEAHADLERTSWVPPEQGYHLHHWFELQARAETAMYEGNASAVYERLAPTHAGLARSLLFRVESVRMNLDALWGRYSLSLAADGRLRERALRDARRNARRLAKEANPFARTMAVFMHAGVAARERDEQAAVARLQEAEAMARKLDLGCFEHAALLRRGQLLGGSEGDAMVARAKDWMRREGVLSPPRLVDVLVPGF